MEKLTEKILNITGYMGERAIALKLVDHETFSENRGICALADNGKYSKTPVIQDAVYAEVD